MNAEPVYAWVAREILPHESLARNWLKRRFGQSIDVDDVIQEACCRIAELESVAHIRCGRSYFFTTVRTIAIDTLRSARVANLKPMTEMDWSNVMDDNPLPEQVFEAGRELERVSGLLSRLSPVCRQVIELRRIHGLSQAETARQLGISENVVENHVSRGIKSILKALAEQDAQAATTKGKPDWEPPRPMTGMKRLQPGRRTLLMET